MICRCLQGQVEGWLTSMLRRPSGLHDLVQGLDIDSHFWTHRRCIVHGRFSHENTRLLFNEGSGGHVAQILAIHEIDLRLLGKIHPICHFSLSRSAFGQV